MSKIYSSLLFVLFFFAANAQNNIVIKGTVYDINTQKPLESAMVYFSNVKDSTVVEYTTTDKNGEFKISTKKYDKPVFLKINFMGYQTYTEEQNKLLENKDFGKLYLSQNETELKEVVIKTDAPPIKIKKDTLEFNAASFKVRPDANVETLLKQLPGVEVDTDGKVTANGKEVTQFLVNGKSFFGKDGAILLKNMPADMINKIQVSDFKTKKEELSKQEASSDNSSINFTIDEKKNKGIFGKVMGGYGTDDRYENSLILNYFNNKRKISLLGSANNINSTGFAQDEVFDNMGGGRNSRQATRATASGKGITKTNMLSFNYTDEWAKVLNTTAGYDFKNTVNKNKMHSDQADFISSTSTNRTISDSETRNEGTENKANFEFEYKIDPTTRLVVTPNISKSNTKSYSKYFGTTTDKNGDELNTNDGNSDKENTSTNFGNTINFNKAFERKARNLSFVFSNNNSNSDSDAINISFIDYKIGNKPDVDRDQNAKSKNTADSYSTEIEFTEPITDSLRIRFGTELGWENEVNDAKTYDKDDSDVYSVLNNLQSNYITSKQNSITPKAGLTFEKNNFTFTLSSRTSIVDYHNHSLYLDKTTDLNKQYVLPYGNAQVRYRFDKSKFITFRYNYSSSLPSATQLMPVANLSNPLNTIIGNQDLNLNKVNSVNINYRNFDVRTRSGYNLFAAGDFFDSQIVSSSIYDFELDSDGNIVLDANGKPITNGKRTTTYKNVSGAYKMSAGGSWGKSIKMDAHVIRYGLRLNGNYSLDKGYTNAVLYSTKSLGVSPSVYFSYDYGELLTVMPSYGLSYSESRYSNSSIKASSNIVHRIGIQTTNYWPKNWIFGNDFGYNYNSNAPTFYLWNTSLSYGFFQKKMTLKVKVYDVLNQNQSVTRTISATTIRDEENTVLKRYAMFSLTYKIGSFGGSRERRSQGGGGGRRGGMDMD